VNKTLVGRDTTAPTHAGNAAYYSGSLLNWTAAAANDMVFYVYGEEPAAPATSGAAEIGKFLLRKKRKPKWMSVVKQYLGLKLK
jgi:hypothetical protein